MTSHDAADIDKHVRTYIMVFVSLMALTLVTVAVSFLDLGVAAGIGVALLIASVKGSLVACYFMHLIDERKLIYTVLAFTVFFFLAVLILPVITQVNSVEIQAS
ncbi:MAG: cytochrome C oxidase subunit IV family protein [Rhodothermales bacterium]|nr:cytochrome C oxidase subunit IV family protein [Rhodothermales bacterium]